MSDNQKFKEWIDSLPKKQISATVNRILEECCISRRTYYNWRIGSCKIPELAKKVINNIAQEISESQIF